MTKRLDFSTKTERITLRIFMKKLYTYLLMFIFSGSVFQAHADEPYSKILFKDKNQIHIGVIRGWNNAWEDALNIAVSHCNSNNKRFAFGVKRPGFFDSKLDKNYGKTFLLRSKNNYYPNLLSSLKIKQINETLNNKN